jgi:hypothetical protein
MELSLQSVAMSGLTHFDLFSAIDLSFSTHKPVQIEDVSSKDVWDILSSLSSSISLMVTGIVALIGLGIYDRRRREREVIKHQLDSFYRPILQLLDTSKRFHEALVKGKAENFKTLPVLLMSRNSLSKSDFIILKEIVAIGFKVEAIIDRQASNVDSNELRERLGILVRHIRFFRLLVLNNNFAGEPTRFTDFIYPQDINREISIECKRLINKL